MLDSALWFMAVLCFLIALAVMFVMAEAGPANSAQRGWRQDARLTEMCRRYDQWREPFQMEARPAAPQTVPLLDP